MIVVYSSEYSRADDEASKVRQGMIKVRILNGIAINRYANDPGKLAASASHVEKAPKKKSLPTP